MLFYSTLNQCLPYLSTQVQIELWHAAQALFIVILLHVPCNNLIWNVATSRHLLRPIGSDRFPACFNVSLVMRAIVTAIPEVNFSCNENSPRSLSEIVHSTSEEPARWSSSPIITTRPMDASSKFCWSCGENGNSSALWRSWSWFRNNPTLFLQMQRRFVYPARSSKKATGRIFINCWIVLSLIPWMWFLKAHVGYMFLVTLCDYLLPCNKISTYPETRWLYMYTVVS